MNSKQAGEDLTCRSARPAAGACLLFWLLNVVLPGTGLILCRREWVGLLVAVVFGVCGNVAVAAWLIAPAAIPRSVAAGAVVLAGLTWGLAQVLMKQQIAALGRRKAGTELHLADARRALEQSDAATALCDLEAAEALDDEVIEIYVLRARICHLRGDQQGAEEAWRRVRRLDRRGRYRAVAPGFVMGPPAE